MSLALLPALLLCSEAAQADIYRAVDRDGRIVFTDVRPTAGRWERLYATKTAPVRAQPAPDARRFVSNNGSPRFVMNSGSASLYAHHIQAAAAANNIDPALIRAVISAESGYNPYAVSRTGAVGLMQLMPQTASRYNVANSRDPEQNIHGGARYLRDLLAMFNNDKRLALAAYNAGEQAVMKYGNRIPPFRETVAYVPKVLQYYERYRNGYSSPHESSSYQHVAAPARRNSPPKSVVMYLSNSPS